MDSLLLQALNKPEQMATLSLASWDLLIRQARSAGLLTNLYDSAERLNLLGSIPERPRNHLQSMRIMTNKHQRDIRWEVRCILEALEAEQHPVILLKGAAYLMAELPVSKARLFSDVDILVPKTVINDVEQTLRLKGWISSTPDAYDQRYYRTWMHELPPLHHRVRNTTLDVHHNILPTTAKLHPDPEKLRQSAIPVEGYDKLQTLTPADMVLHSATHLFHDGELEHGLRDLVDLDGLLRHFSAKTDFWETLVGRAGELDLQRPLYYALRYTSQQLNTPVPEATMVAVSQYAPPSPLASLMDLLFRRALAPDHPSCSGGLTGASRLALYIRSHYLRMPLHLLIPHLLHKAFASPKNKD